MDRPRHVHGPNTGLQALVLCGPGVSLTTLTLKPEEFPKALIPIANRPMVWYALYWCYRMGIARIALVTPPSSAKVLEAALAQNPHLTALPSPKPELLAPSALSDTAGTAEILRLPEIQSWLSGDFLLLPCDLVCDLPGERLLDIWLNEGARSGLGMWYETKDQPKGHETDFVITAPLPPSLIPSDVSCILSAMPTDSLHDLLDRKKMLPVRRAMLQRFGKVELRTTRRDSHVYIFPAWVKDFVRENPEFDSISEDVVGWWAKATWQKGLAQKLHIKSHPIAPTLSSTSSGLAHNDLAPPMLGYMHSSEALVRRVDTAALVLSTSIRLAALPALDDAEMLPSLLSHPQKIATDPTLIAAHTTIHAASSLIGPETSIATHCKIKTSCLGANCNIGGGVKISGSVLMDGVEVEAQAQIQNCVVGRRCFIGKGANLNGCEIQEGYRVDAGTEGAPGEKMSVFEGLENGLDELEASPSDEGI